MSPNKAKDSGKDGSPVKDKSSSGAQTDISGKHPPKQVRPVPAAGKTASATQPDSTVTEKAATKTADPPAGKSSEKTVEKAANPPAPVSTDKSTSQPDKTPAPPAASEKTVSNPSTEKSTDPVPEKTAKVIQKERDPPPPAAQTAARPHSRGNTPPASIGPEVQFLPPVQNKPPTAEKPKRRRTQEPAGQISNMGLNLQQVNYMPPTAFHQMQAPPPAMTTVTQMNPATGRFERQQQPVVQQPALTLPPFEQMSALQQAAFAALFGLTTGQEQSAVTPPQQQYGSPLPRGQMLQQQSAVPTFHYAPAEGYQATVPAQMNWMAGHTPGMPPRQALQYSSPHNQQQQPAQRPKKRSAPVPADDADVQHLEEISDDPSVLMPESDGE